MATGLGAKLCLSKVEEAEMKQAGDGYEADELHERRLPVGPIGSTPRWGICLDRLDPCESFFRIFRAVEFGVKRG